MATIPGMREKGPQSGPPAAKRDVQQAQAFVAWMAILNFAFLTAMPATLLAEAPPIPSGTEPALVVAGTDLCVQRCKAEETRCSEEASTQGTTDTTAICDARIKSCYAECQLVPKLGLTPDTGKEGHKKTETSASTTAELKQKSRELALAKHRIAEFVSNLGRIKMRIAQNQKIGLQPPAGMLDAVAQGETLINSLKSATDQSAALGTIQSQLDAIGQTLKDDLALMQKQTAALKRFSSLNHMMFTLDRQRAYAERLSASDPSLADKVAAFGTSIDALKTAEQQAKDAINSGDVDGGYAILNTKIPDLLKAISQARQDLMQAKSASSGDTSH